MSLEKEYYILMANTEVLGVFETLEECLTWTPPYTIQDDIVIHRIRKFTDGRFQNQKIPVNKEVFNEKIE